MLALMPVPGDVDIVLASKLMEAARRSARFRHAGPDAAHRLDASRRTPYQEIALADDRTDATALLKALARQRSELWPSTCRRSRTRPAAS